MSGNYRQVISYPRVTLKRNEDYSIEINYVQPTPGVLMTFVHVDFDHFNHSVMKDFLKTYLKLRPLLPDVIFCHGNNDDAKFVRFLSHFGWQQISEAMCSDGNQRRLFAHFRDDTHGFWTETNTDDEPADHSLGGPTAVPAGRMETCAGYTQ